DDSGLEVDALAGAPGLNTARFGGPGLGDRERRELLLERLRGLEPARRTARFRCVIALVGPTLGEQVVEGVVEGIIAEAARGSGGFGYSPVFFYPPRGPAFGGLSDEEKARVPHGGAGTHGNGCRPGLVRSARPRRRGRLGLRLPGRDQAGGRPHQKGGSGEGDSRNPAVDRRVEEAAGRGQGPPRERQDEAGSRRRGPQGQDRRRLRRRGDHPAEPVARQRCDVDTSDLAVTRSSSRAPRRASARRSLTSSPTRAPTWRSRPAAGNGSRPSRPRSSGAGAGRW